MTAIQLDIVIKKSLSKAQREDYLAKSRAADTIATYVNLTVLLNTYDSIGKELDKGRNTIGAKDDFFNINTKILHTIKTDSAYLASRLSARDMGSLNMSLKGFIARYDSIKALGNLVIVPVTDLKTTKQTFAPEQIKGKLDHASREILKKVD